MKKVYRKIDGTGNAYISDEYTIIIATASHPLERDYSGVTFTLLLDSEDMPVLDGNGIAVYQQFGDPVTTVNPEWIEVTDLSEKLTVMQTLGINI